jgi:hypothetical protein
MKRLIALAALLLAASACATTTDNANATANTNTNANANAAPSATPTPSDVSQADIEAKERQAWDAVKSKNVDALGALLADDFTNVNDTGVYDKAGTVKGMQGEGTTDITLSNFKLLKVDEDAAAVTYDVAWTGAHEGKPRTVNLRASSAWAKRGGAWLAVYHQATAVGEPPAGEAPKAGVSPTAPASNSNAANANTSNANASNSLPPEAPDPVSKEKKLWDELKARDYDAFATDLADEAVEVEPRGRYDKAGSISGVKSMDASRYALSDWKETKIDADASVVTYLVKSTDGKEEERHATVWAKRGQRWYAILHQGTPVSKTKK